MSKKNHPQDRRFNEGISWRILKIQAYAKINRALLSRPDSKSSKSSFTAFADQCEIIGDGALGVPNAIVARIKSQMEFRQENGSLNSDEQVCLTLLSEDPVLLDGPTVRLCKFRYLTNVSDNGSFDAIFFGGGGAVVH